MRRRMVPMRSTVLPKSLGSAVTTSLLMREASLQPLPDVVIPICSGPSEWVQRSVKVQRLGASMTLTGIRFRLHNLEMCVPAVNAVSF